MKIITSGIQFLKSHASQIQTFLPQAIATGLITLSLIVLIAAGFRTWGNDPPIYLTSLDPEHLGILCPGQEMVIHNRVHIADNIITIYYISVKNLDGSNVFGTQKAITDLLYPDVVTFNEKVPWQVPTLPIGDYVRVFAVRNVEGHQNTVFVKSAFRIGEDC